MSTSYIETGGDVSDRGNFSVISVSRGAAGQTHLNFAFFLILALVVVLRGLDSWRSGSKAASRGIPLAAAFQDAAAGTQAIWSAVASKARHRFHAQENRAKK